MMRLTLRTLLAWLDDKLPPSQVREIGKQVAESPLAKEIVDRIHLVTRQRRLTVPGTTGPDATDPNLVASYIDNELDADHITEYEKLCLTSDVHLAEAASVHQVLSLIGQKAKVPAEVRSRMYGLIKGRESISPQMRRTAGKAPIPEPISEPVQPWVMPAPPRRPWYERFGPLAAVLALLTVLCWTAWKSVSEPVNAPEVVQNTPEGNPPFNPNVPAPVVPKTVPEPPKAPEPPPVEPEKMATRPEAPPGDVPSADPKAKPPLPTGSIGRLATTDGVILRATDEGAENWLRLSPEAVLKSQDRLLNLAPFRSVVELGTARVELVGESEVRLRSAMPDQAARFQLVQGRVLLRGTAPAAPFEVQIAGRTVAITPPTGVAVGLERLNRRETGSTTPLGPVLRIFVPEGEVELAAGEVGETLSGPGDLTFEPPGRFTRASTRPAPAWVTEDAPHPSDVQIGAQFLKAFRPEKGVLLSLNEALGDEAPPTVRQLALSSLRALGDVKDVVPMLNVKNDPATRRAAILVLRAYLAEGPESARALRQELLAPFGAAEADEALKLLVGFTPKEAKEEATYSGLLKELATTEENLVGLRELALDNLQALTDRDDLGYNPDKPTGKGLSAWQSLQRSGELKFVEAPKSKKEKAADEDKEQEQK